MYAALVIVDGADTDAGVTALNDKVIPRARQAGARAGIWVYRGEGVGTSILTFDDEATARAFAARLTAGEAVMPDEPDSPIVRSIEVCPIVATF